jgi:hypothetical protein
MKNMRMALIGYCFFVMLPACTSPTARLESAGKQFNLQSLDLNAGGFKLSCFYRPGADNEKMLHVYLEGDGRPWQNGLIPAADPTTRDSVMLPLLALDSTAALYLGRPCYNGHADDAGCEAGLWTSARYGEQVLKSMTSGLEEFMRHYAYSKLVLIGHSGGGSLAMLMSMRLPQIQRVVTLAGNYDINLWTDFHGYQRLSDSYNPAELTNQGVSEWHFLGELDKNIPPKLFLGLLQNRNHSHVEILSGVSHQLGWVNYWPEILSRLKHE